MAIAKLPALIGSSAFPDRPLPAANGIFVHPMHLDLYRSLDLLVE